MPASKPNGIAEVARFRRLIGPDRINRQNVSPVWSGRGYAVTQSGTESFTIPVLDQDNLQYNWTYNSGGEKFTFQYHIVRDSLKMTLTQLHRCICIHWHSDIEITIKFVDQYGDIMKTLSENLKMTWKSFNRLQLQTVRIRDVESVLDGKSVVRLELKIILKSSQGIHRWLYRHDHFFSSGKSEHDIFFTFGDRTDGMSVSKQLLTFYSCHFRNLIHHGKYSRSYPICGSLKLAFEDWINVCYGSIWVKFLSLKRLDDLLKFAVFILSDSVFFDIIEKNLVECCQFYRDYARNMIICNRYHLKLVKHEVQCALNRDDKAMLIAETSPLSTEYSQADKLMIKTAHEMRWLFMFEHTEAGEFREEPEFVVTYEKRKIEEATIKISHELMILAIVSCYSSIRSDQLALLQLLQLKEGQTEGGSEGVMDEKQTITNGRNAKSFVAPTSVPPEDHEETPRQFRTEQD